MEDFSFYQYIAMAASGLIIGMAKGGIRGIDAFNVVLMAIVFGSKQSTGIILPLLCIADVLAVIYYKKSVNWKIFLRLLPSMIFGVLVGLYIGNEIDALVFKRFIAAIVIATLVIIYFLEVRKLKIVPNNAAFTHGMGFVAGFTTMIGNLAGAFANIYFLGLRLPKVEFLGTVSWVFLFINLFKMPLQALVWKNINMETLQLDLPIVPFVFIGFFIGVNLVKKISEELFRKIVLVMTLIGSGMILVF